MADVPLESLWIDHSEGLKSFIDEITPSHWLAVDTEFIRERTYYPVLCVIQVSNGTRHALIDAQADIDFTPLTDRLRDPECICVLHACLQDAETLHHEFDLIPTSVFDTQIAWAFLGHGYQTSYAAIVEHRTGIQLDKSEVRSRWDRRPLREAQLRYALQDVLHLQLIYQQLHQELQERDRLNWMKEETARLLTASSWQQDPEHSWRRVRNPDRPLTPRSRGALQSLAHWREVAAVRNDLPRRRVLADETLLELAQTMPKNREQFDQIMPHRLAKVVQDDLWIAMERAHQASELMGLPPPPNDSRETVQRLVSIVRDKAEEIQISRELLAPRAMVEELVQGRPDPLLLQGWRRQAIGQELADALHGG